MAVNRKPILSVIAMMTDFQFDIGESSEAAPPDAFVLCTPKGWDSYISREFHEIHQNLASLGWTMMVVDETDDERLRDVIRRARLVLLWECYEILERLADSFATLPKHIRRVVFCDDVHYFNEHRRAQRLRAFHWADLILATYPNKLTEWFPDVKKRIKWTPHSAASAFSPVFAPVFDRVLLSGLAVSLPSILRGEATGRRMQHRGSPRLSRISG
ncbi:hypothetical protein C9I57_08270 [Trinickia symbiotica]|uniref:Glycosyltransferase family 1 protein n=2 Tax=Trinickia symbiotica TaxID=863227 RepID=A0A2T3XYM1_9BURK|nr:hypothetical protein C9I57_08270 [Trinickia symbiotica]